MYNITVPIINTDLNKFGGRDTVLAEIKKLGACRVMLAVCDYITDPSLKDELLNNLRENCDFFKSNGLEVGVWNLGTGVSGYNPFTRITAANGWKAGPHACPADPEFVRFAGDYIADLASCGVDMILFDDDLKYSFYGGNESLTCTCAHHMKRICEMFGEDISPQILAQKALCGEGNKYRDAWIRSKGDSLREFATHIRQCVDRIDPDIRIGICSEMSLWDIDGIDTEELALILAGNTKPFIRLIGAPYWAVNRSIGNSRLQHVIEYERMERSWCSNIAEIVCEGDVYPRPRHTCPSAYLELFDMALRADGGFDGIMKYALDYYSSAKYERGYIDRHIKNTDIYQAIEKSFSGKKAAGIRVYEEQKRISDMRIPESLTGSLSVESVFFSPAAKMMSDCSIPTVYEGVGVCSVAFGENIKYVPEAAMKQGIIIDMGAATILMEKGIDVGIREVGGRFRPNEEYFADYEDQIQHTAGGLTAYKLTLDSNAEIKSSFIVNKSIISYKEQAFPATFIYEAPNGYKFLIFAFDCYFNGEAMNRSYLRSLQISDTVKRFSGSSLPAYCFGNPDLYIMAKKGGGKMAVGLWNIFADSIFEPVAELDGEYKNISFINCSGKLEGNKVFLSDIPPFSFAGFEVI